MNTYLIVIISVAVLLLILYLASAKLEFRVTKNTETETPEKTDKSLEHLSNSELNVLKLCASGKSNQEIADELFISVHTVKKHISNIFRKLGITSRKEMRKFKKYFN